MLSVRAEEDISSPESDLGLTLGLHKGEERLEALEIKLLLEGLYAYYGYDFRDYALSSLRRRVLEQVITEGLTSVSRLQELVLRDKQAFERLFLKLSVNVTSFFRDALFFRTYRDVVVPKLKEQEFIRIWHTGCATGEEVYSSAIILHEEGLLDRCRIYATDMNESVLRRARSGIYATTQLDLAELAYTHAGGKQQFSGYYTTKYDHSMLHRSLRENIHFSQHNLVTDGLFNEFDVIFARNVLIYFNKSLQDNVNTLLNACLVPGGYIGFGERESLRYTPIEPSYELVSSEGAVNTGFYHKLV